MAHQAQAQGQGQAANNINNNFRFLGDNSPIGYQQNYNQTAHNKVKNSTNLMQYQN